MDTNTDRHLAAIMFADMEGFTALMQRDEQRAKLSRDRQRTVLEKHIALHGGKLVQYYGDGSLTVFKSAIEAVKCAVAIQVELQQEPRVNLRIGLHSGDVAYDEHGVYGDCVNIASRIESISAAGAVLISEKIFDEIKNQRLFKTQPVGKFNFKNVNKAIEVFAIDKDGLTIPKIKSNLREQPKEILANSIAVLPFVNMSADPANEYFSDGISEEILNALARVNDLHVIARTSSFHFKGKNEDIREIGRQLNVATLVEGSVRKAGNKVRITAQFINALDGCHYWSETYDRQLEDIFSVQDEIAQKIVTRLKERFAPATSPIIKAPTDNIEAYNLYLKGRFYWNKFNPDAIRQAIKIFENVIQLEPTFALPYCALSYCYSFMGSSGQINPSEAYPKAQDYTLKALELDPNHAEAHLSLAAIRFFHKWDFDGAEASLNRALALSLHSSQINQVHGWFLISKGEFVAAIEKMKQALALDPLSTPLLANLADAYAFAQRYDDAMATYDKVIELDPNFRRAVEGKGMIYLAMKEYDKAVETLEHYKALVGDDLKGNSSLGYAYGMAGRTDKAMECLEKVKRREALDPKAVLFIDYAVIYAGLNDRDKVFENLNKAYAARMGIACMGMIFCVRHPLLTQIRQDPRFLELVQSIGM